MGRRLKKEDNMENLEENKIPTNFELDVNNEEPLVIPKERIEYNQANNITNTHSDSEEIISCLRNERVVARMVPKNIGNYKNPKHVLSGGMAEGVTKSFTVPLLSSGMYVNVLTDSEKKFLEYILGLEKNALSIYRKKDNFWENFFVILTKEDNYFNLKDPMDYIRYKVLLCNTDLICPNLETLHNTPKASYKYVLFIEGEQEKKDKQNMSATMEAYKEYGKYEDNKDVLRTVLEIIQQKPIAPNTKLDWIQGQLNPIIQQQSKLFLKVIQDPFLLTKVLIKKGVEVGLLANRGGYYYIKRDNNPLCSHGQDPNLTNASKYLALPQNQELRFNLEAQIKELSN